MRLIAFILCALTVLSAPSRADQTDPRLDLLFEELRTGDAISAEETTARIIDIWAQAPSDTVNLLYMRALVSADEGAFDLALALLDHIVGLAPNFAQGYALRGAVQLSRGDPGAAIADFVRTLELEPRQFEVRIALAELLLGNGDKREAYEMYQKALEWNPHDEHARMRARVLRRTLDGQEI